MHNAWLECLAACFRSFSRRHILGAGYEGNREARLWLAFDDCALGEPAHGGREIEGRRYLVKVADLELACAGCDGWQTTPEALEAMARDIASRIPELSSEGGERLAELLRG